MAFEGRFEEVLKLVEVPLEVTFATLRLPTEYLKSSRPKPAGFGEPACIWCWTLGPQLGPMQHMHMLLLEDPIKHPVAQARIIVSDIGEALLW